MLSIEKVILEHLLGHEKGVKLPIETRTNNKKNNRPCHSFERVETQKKDPLQTRVTH